MDPTAVQQAIHVALQQQQAKHDAAIQALQQQLMAVSAGVSSPKPSSTVASGAAPPRAFGGARLPSPEPFTGHPAKLEEWCAGMRKQFAWYEVPLDKQVRFAYGFLSGPAFDWFEHEYAAPASAPATWDLLVEALRKRFQPVTTAETARAKLLALQQGKSPVNDYIAAFRRLLVSVPDMSPSDQLFQFRRGLRPAIAVRLQEHGVSTLSAAIEMAARIGSVGEHVSQGAAGAPSAGAAMELDALDIEGLEPETASSGPEGRPHEDAPCTRAEFQQLLNAMQQLRRAAPPAANRGSGPSRPPNQRRGAPTIPHLSPQQVQEYMVAGKCFGCGSTEHQSRQCPKRKVGADGRVSWVN